ncbi:MAG: hypothetical protein NVV60_11480 [Luteimonas sp.]|nr:hypothetical protein [Luteimonas sp.]
MGFSQRALNQQRVALRGQCFDHLEFVALHRQCRAVGASVTQPIDRVEPVLHPADGHRHLSPLDRRIDAICTGTHRMPQPVIPIGKHQQQLGAQGQGMRGIAGIERIRKRKHALGLLQQFTPFHRSEGDRGSQLPNHRFPMRFREWIAIGVERAIDPLREVPAQHLLQQGGMFGMAVVEEPPGHGEPRPVAEFTEGRMWRRQHRQRIHALVQHLARIRSTIGQQAALDGKIVQDLVQEGHADPASPAEHVLVGSPEFIVEVLLDASLAITLPFSHVALTAGSERSRDISSDEACRLAEQGTHVLGHGQEVAVGLVQHQLPLPGGQAGQLHIEVGPEIRSRRLAQQAHLCIGLQPRKHGRCLGLRIAIAQGFERLPPFTLPVRGDDQQWQSARAGLGPCVGNEALADRIAPLRIVQPQHDRQRFATHRTTAQHFVQHLQQFLAGALPAGLLLSLHGHAAIAEATQRRHCPLRQLAHQPGKRHHQLRGRHRSFAKPLPLQSADHAIAQLGPTRAVVACGFHVRQQFVAQIRQRADALLHVARLRFLPAHAEPQEAGRPLRHVAEQFGVDEQRFAGTLEGVGPIVDLLRIPSLVAGQPLVQGLHQATLAQAAVRHDHGQNRPRSARCLSPFLHEPRKFAFPPEKPRIPFPCPHATPRYRRAHRITLHDRRFHAIRPVLRLRHESMHRDRRATVKLSPLPFKPSHASDDRSRPHHLPRL